MGQLTAKRIAVASGRERPLRPFADEWLATQHKPSKTMTDYRKALDRLCERFETVEDAVKPGAPRRFLVELLTKLRKPTVTKYCSAFRGLWELNGMNPDVWSTKRLGSLLPSTRRIRWTDEEYHRLLDECDRKGDRRLRLGIRIAAHTGAAASGVAGLEVKRDEAGRLSLWLPETKKDHRPRLIPCHPDIEDDVVEWSQNPFTPKYLSKRFGEMKTAMGFDNTPGTPQPPPFHLAQARKRRGRDTPDQAAAGPQAVRGHHLWHLQRRGPRVRDAVQDRDEDWVEGTAGGTAGTFQFPRGRGP